MTSRLEEITQKIYNDGVVKAQSDADQIIADAKNRADKIIKAAKKEHQEIIHNAEKAAMEIQKTSQAELQLSAQQFTSNLKQQITSLVTSSQVDGYIKEAFSEVEFIQRMILTILKNWNPAGDESMQLKLLLPEKEQEEFTAFFKKKTNAVLTRGVNISFDSALTNGFKIGPQNGSYIISFTDKDFENYFKRYFKDRTKDLLFGSVNNE